MKKIFGWLLFRQTRLIAVEIPIALYHALETVTHMHNNNVDEEDEPVTRDEIVTIALAKYMQENLWTNSVEDVKVVTQVKRKDIPYRVK